MDPLSIASACIAISGNIFNLSKQISSFVSGVRDARSDMGAVTKELSSLSYALQLLQHDFSEFSYPESLQKNLSDVLRNCDEVVCQMQQLLTKLSSGNLRKRIRWAFDGRDDMNRLRSSLEAHKSAIEIALEVGALFILNKIDHTTSEVKADTTKILEDTSHIASVKQDTTQIATLHEEILLLRQQVNTLQTRDGKRHVLQRFLDESTAYAETVPEQSSTDQHIAGSSPGSPARDLPMSDAFSFPEDSQTPVDQTLTAAPISSSVLTKGSGVDKEAVSTRTAHHDPASAKSPNLAPPAFAGQENRERLSADKGVKKETPFRTNREASRQSPPATKRHGATGKTDTFVFRWPYPARDVYVIGYSYDWDLAEQLVKVGDMWEKEVHLPLTVEKIFYQFWVDSVYTVDPEAPLEQMDESFDVYNVLYPHLITEK